MLIIRYFLTRPITLLPSIQKAPGSVSWTKDEEKILLQIVADSLNAKEVHTDVGFSKTNWTTFVSEFKKRTSISRSKDKLQSKLNEQKSLFKCWQYLKNLSGAGVDNETGNFFSACRYDIASIKPLLTL